MRIRPLESSLALILVLGTAGPTLAQRTPAPQISADWLDAAEETAQAEQYAIGRDASGRPLFSNAANGLQASFVDGALHVTPARARLGQWRLSLETTGFGVEGELLPLAPPIVSDRGARLEIARGALIEWFENRPEGIEQGWTLIHPPASAGAAPLWIQLESRGSLSWRLETGACSAALVDGEGVQRLAVSGLRAWDANGRDVPVRFGSGPDGFGVRVDAAAASYPITVDPLITSAFALLEADQPGAKFGAAVCFAGDVNGDGFGDVAVGAPLYDYLGFVDSGAVFVYLGSPGGLQTSAVWSFGGGQNFAAAGSSLACAGDVDDDGFDDLLVGAPKSTFGQAFEGAAYLFLGSAAGLATLPAWSGEGNASNAEFGFSLAGAGHTNGDGFADWIIGAPGVGTTGAAYVYEGSSLPLSAQRRTLTAQSIDRRFGHSVAGLGNTNLDGFDDVLVGAPETTNSASHSGVARKFVGAAAGINTTSVWNAGGGLAANTRYGTVVACAGDFNGDGTNDILIGAPTSPNPFAGGTFWLYGGNNASSAWLVQGFATAGSAFGFSLGCAGDVNADGYADFYCGSPGVSSSAGSFRMYHGSATPTVADFVNVSLGTAGDRFGEAISAAGDVDGDGYSDLIVGSPLDDNGATDEGTARVFRGAPESLWAAPVWTKTEGAVTFAHWGAAVVSIGDVNGDGFEDLAAAEPDVAVNKSKVWVYHGSASGPSLGNAWNLGVGIAPADRFGASLAGCDFNGDGYDDLVVAAPGAQVSAQVVGRVSVYFGSSSGLSLVAAYSAVGTSPGAGFGEQVAAIGDVDGDGDEELAVGAPLEGFGGVVQIHDKLRYGASVSVSTLVSPHGNSEFGRSVASAGDVNGDGYMDAIVGAPKAKPAIPSEAGAAYVYLGSHLGLQSAPAWQIGAGYPTGAHLGSAVCGLGDVNGDGFGDVLVGAPDYVDAASPNGLAALHLGAASGPSANAAWLGGAAAGSHSLGGYGAAVSRAGDVNGDGFGDWLVGSPRLGVGSVTLYHGGMTLGANPLSLTTSAANSPAKTAHFGAAISAGDFDGNGFGDVIVGAPFSSPATEGGRTDVYLGNGKRRSILRTLRAYQFAGTPISDGGRTQTLGWVPIGTTLVGSLATYSVFGDVLPQVHLELEFKPLGVPFDGTELEQGSTAFDVLTGTAVAIDDVFRACKLSDLAAELLPRSMVHWRARLKLGNTLLQHTPWIVPDGHAASDGTLRSRP